MASYTLPSPAPLDLCSGNLAESWKKWRKRFDNFELATGVSTKSDAERVATIIAVIGDAAVDVYDTFTWETEGENQKLEKVYEKFEAHCAGKKNITYERYVFNTRSQLPGEDIDSFVTALRNLASSCEFGNLKLDLIRDRVVIGVNNPKMTQRLLRTEDLTLDKALSIIRADVAATAQLAKMNERTDRPQQARAVCRKQSDTSKPKSWSRNKPSSQPKPSSQKSQTQSTRKRTCRNCGGDYPHPNGKECPALGKTCNYCQKKNHFAVKCRKKARASANTVDNVDASDSDAEAEEEFAYILRASTSDNTDDEKQPHVDVKLNDQIVNVLLDTGATVNVMTTKQYKKLKNKPKMYSTKTIFFAYGAKKQLPVLGKIHFTVNCNDRQITAIFYFLYSMLYGTCTSPYCVSLVPRDLKSLTFM